MAHPDALNTGNIAHSPMQPRPISNEEIDRRNAEIEPTFRAWKCEVIDNRMRPSGFKQTQGCGYWQTNRSTLAEPFATCKQCGRKARLNPRTRRITEFASKEAANAFTTAMNNHPDAVPQPDAPTPPPVEQKALICHPDFPCGNCSQCSLPEEDPLLESLRIHLMETGQEVDF